MEDSEGQGSAPLLAVCTYAVMIDRLSVPVPIPGRVQWSHLLCRLLERRMRRRGLGSGGLSSSGLGASDA